MILGILQARTSSTRLPGKVMRPILDQPMLARQIERVRRCDDLELLVATSREPGDDAIAALCDELSVPCARGSLSDVLDRFYRAAQPWAPEHIVRLTGDCPLADPKLISEVVALHLREGNDYTSNTLRLSFPDGLDVEIVRYRCLEEAWREARDPGEREHVTPFFYRRPERYQLGCLEAESDYSKQRWTVDHPEDLEFVTQVFEALYPENPHFDMSDVLALLERDPGLAIAARRGVPA